MVQLSIYYLNSALNKPHILQSVATSMCSSQAKGTRRGNRVKMAEVLEHLQGINNASTEQKFPPTEGFFIVWP